MKRNAAKLLADFNLPPITQQEKFLGLLLFIQYVN